MEGLIVAFVCALAVTANASDSKKGLQNIKQPKVVSIYDNGSRICTGVMIFDLTILCVDNCFTEYVTRKYNATIKFPNDKKTYKVAVKVYYRGQQHAKTISVDFAILSLKEEDKPPKCEWTFQLPKSGKHYNKGQVTLIRNYNDKDVVQTMDVTPHICKNDEYLRLDSNETICVKAGAIWETNDEDIGAPLFFGGEFAGVMMMPEDSLYPSLYELLFYDREFFEKLPQNPSNNGKTAKKDKAKNAH